MLTTPVHFNPSLRLGMFSVTCMEPAGYLLLRSSSPRHFSFIPLSPTVGSWGEYMSCLFFIIPELGSFPSSPAFSAEITPAMWPPPFPLYLFLVSRRLLTLSKKGQVKPRFGVYCIF